MRTFMFSLHRSGHRRAFSFHPYDLMARGIRMEGAHWNLILFCVLGRRLGTVTLCTSGYSFRRAVGGITDLSCAISFSQAVFTAVAESGIARCTRFLQVIWRAHCRWAQGRRKPARFDAYRAGAPGTNLQRTFAFAFLTGATALQEHRACLLHTGTHQHQPLEWERAVHRQEPVSRKQLPGQNGCLGGRAPHGTGTSLPLSGAPGSRQTGGTYPDLTINTVCFRLGACGAFGHYASMGCAVVAFPEFPELGTHPLGESAVTSSAPAAPLLI